MLENGTAPALAQLLVKEPVLVSTNSVEDSDYKTSGHIVSVLAIDKRPSSPTPLLVLNPAIKIKDESRNVCTMDGFGAGDKDTNWSAGISWIRKYEIKHLTMGQIRKGGC